MPPKRARSTSIGRRSSSAQRSRLRRLNESAEQRETRLGQQRVRQSQNFANETEAQSQIRLEAVAARNAVRANESQENREIRLSQQRIRQSQNLANETELQSQIRLEAVAARCSKRPARAEKEPRRGDLSPDRGGRSRAAASIYIYI